MHANVAEKAALTLFLILTAIAAPWFLNVLLILVLLAIRQTVTAFKPLDEKVRRRFRKVLLTLTTAAVLMIIANGVLIREGSVVAKVSSIHLYAGGIFFGLRVAARLLLIATAILMFFGSTPFPRIATFLDRMGLPTPVVMTFLLTLYYLDHVPEKLQRIFTAQEARGAPVRSHVFARLRSLSTVLSPLLLSSLVESVDRSTALALRGFHAGTKLSFSGEPDQRRSLSAWTIVFLVLSLLVIIWLVIRWLFPSTSAI